MPDYPTMHDLGRIDVVTFDDRPALSRDTAFDIASVQATWLEFEGAFDSLQGRTIMRPIYSRDGVYRMSSVQLDRDDSHLLCLDKAVILGRRYLRLRFRGSAPMVYEQIAPAFDMLFEHVDHDPERPHIEYYHSEGDIDCLVPLRPAP